MWYNTINLDSGLDRQSAGCRGEYFYIQYKPRIAFSNYKKGCCFMKKKVISMLLAVSMISTSPIYAAEFSDGNSVIVNDADAVNGTDADSADSAEIPDTSLFSSDAVDGAGDVNDSVDAGGDAAENAFSDQEVPDVDDGSGSGVDAAEYVPGKEAMIKKAAKDIVAQSGIKDNNTDLEKLCMLLSWFRKYTVYDYDKIWPTNDAYGALILRKSNCYGFNEGLVYLLKECGIKGKMCIGGAPGQEDHAWTEVLLNGSWYIIDATAVSYQKGSFLEDYKNFWYHPDLSSSYETCSSAYSTGSIAGDVRYLGALGNDLYIVSDNCYYKNSGVGWSAISKEEVPTVLYGECDSNSSSEVSSIACGYENSYYGKRIINGTSSSVRFFISTIGGGKMPLDSEFSCQNSNPDVFSASVERVGDGYIDVCINSLKLGKGRLTVSALNGVSCSLNVTVSTIPVPNIAPTFDHSVKGDKYEDSEPYNSIKLNLGGASDKDYCVDGYQLYEYKEKSGTFKKVLDVPIDIKDKDDGNIYINLLVNVGESKQFKARAFIEDDHEKRTYGKFSDVITVAPKPSPIKLESVKNKGKRKLSITLENPDWEDCYYLIYRKDGADGKYKKVKTISGSKIPSGSESIVYIDKNLKKGIKYYYKTKYYYNVKGKKVYSGWSNVKSRTCK